MITLINMFKSDGLQINNDKILSSNNESSGFEEKLLLVSNSLKDLSQSVKNEKTDNLTSDIEESMMALGYMASMLGVPLKEMAQLVNKNSEKINSNMSLVPLLQSGSSNEIIRKITKFANTVEKLISSVENQKSAITKEPFKLSVDSIPLTGEQSEKLTDICSKLLSNDLSFDSNVSNQDSTNKILTKSLDVPNNLQQGLKTDKSMTIVSSTIVLQNNYFNQNINKLSSQNVVQILEPIKSDTSDEISDTSKNMTKTIMPQVEISGASKNVIETIMPQVEISDTSKNVTKPIISLDEISIKSKNATKPLIPLDEINVKSNKYEVLLPFVKILQEIGVFNKSFVNETNLPKDLKGEKIDTIETNQKVIIDFDKMQVESKTSNPELLKKSDEQSNSSDDLSPFGSDLQKLSTKVENKVDNNLSLANAKDTQETIKTQVVDTFMLVSKKGNKEVTLTLNPENLGKLSLKVTTDKDGIRAQIITDNLQVKDTITQQSLALRDLLREQGLKLNTIEVQYKGNTDGSNLFAGSGQQGQQYKSNQQRKFDNLKRYNEDFSTQAIAQEVYSGNIVQDVGFNYLA